MAGLEEPTHKGVVRQKRDGYLKPVTREIFSTLPVSLRQCTSACLNPQLEMSRSGIYQRIRTARFVARTE